MSELSVEPDSLKKTKQKLRLRTSVIDFDSYQNYLKDVYLEIKSRVSSYSYEKFSCDLGLGTSNISYLIIMGQRNLSQSHLPKVIDFLGLRGSQKRYFVALVSASTDSSHKEKMKALGEILRIRAQHQSKSLSQNELLYLSNWLHPVVRELLNFEDFSPDPQWICEKLAFAVTPKAAAKSFELLQKIGMIRFDAGMGKWKQVDTVIEYADEIAENAVAKYHNEMIELAQKSLATKASTSQQMFGFTVGLNAQLRKAILDLIKQFKDQVIETCEEQTQIDEIYQLNIQFFPITNTKHSAGKESLGSVNSSSSGDKSRERSPNEKTKGKSIEKKSGEFS